MSIAVCLLCGCEACHPTAAVLPQEAGAPRIFSGANSGRSQRYYIALLLTSFAVGLLIVFRTNSSYAR